MNEGLPEAVDRLYEDVVLNPEAWNEAAFGEWLEGQGLDRSVGREDAKQLRRAVRAAVKLQRFWVAADADRRRAEPSWRSRVDIAVGAPAWRPPLELAMGELHAHPSPERFDDVRERFRIVNGTSWLEGETYEAWESGRQ